MTNLPGFSKVRGVTKFSELEIDKSFTENMKQLNQKSNTYQWNLQELTLQSDQSITIDTTQSGASIHAVGRPYWKLLYDTTNATLPQIKQEFTLNVQEATVMEQPAEIIISDRNDLLRSEERNDNIIYHYTTSNKTNEIYVGNTMVLYYLSALSSNFLSLSQLDIGMSEPYNLNIYANNFSSYINTTGGVRNIFNIGEYGDNILATLGEDFILTSSTGLPKNTGLGDFVGEQSFDDVMKTLNRNGTENTYLLDGNAKIKIGNNLKVSTEEDTTTTGGEESNEPTS